MGDYFIPFQVQNDPPGVADDLSESLRPGTMEPGGYGYWESRLPSIVYIDLDGIKKTTRLTSIHFTPENRVPWGTFWTADYGKVGFYFAASFDMTDMTVFGFDWLAYDRSYDHILIWPSLTGHNKFFLEDANGKHAWVLFDSNVSSKDKSNFLECRFNKADFTTDANFLWGQVKAWIFEVGLRLDEIVAYSTGGYDVWIDGGPFVNIATTLPTITIKCQDIQGRSIGGKTSLWSRTGAESASQTIPKLGIPVTAGEWTIRILSSDFVKWKFSDGTESTNSSVVITLGSGETFAATAIFQSGDGNGDGGDGGVIDWTPIIIVGGAAAAVGAGYLLLRKKRGRS